MKQDRKIMALCYHFQEDRPTGIMSVLPILFSSVLMALLCYTAPEILADMSGSMKMNIEDGIFYGVLALFTASLLFPRMVARYNKSS